MSPRVINLTRAPWRHEPSDRIAELEADKAAFSRWLERMGGAASSRYAALRAEALQMAGPDRATEYMEMARALDEEHEMHEKNREAGMVVELARRLDAAQAARRRREAEIRLAHDQAAVNACLQRSAELKLAMEELRADPRVAAALDADLTGRASMSPAEVAIEMRARLGLMPRPPTQYEASMPPVADLARAIGLKW